MMRFAPTTRESYVPTGAIKITDKNSDAVVYCYTIAKGKPGALAFHGRAIKPDWHHTFADAAFRERKIRSYFEGRQRVVAARAKRRQEFKAGQAVPHSFEAGHVLYTSWGYEQTNIEFFQVTKLIGRHMVEVCKIARVDASKGNEPWLTGKTLPSLDAVIGKPLRRRANAHSKSIRIDNVRTAFLWDGQPKNWTAYA